MRTFQHISAEAIERYGQRRLSGEELLSAHAHAAGCEECRARLEHVVDVQTSFADLLAGFDAHADEPEHLAYAQLAAFVDGSLDDVEREIAESHLAVCHACAGDAVDLRRYQTFAAASEIAPAKSLASVAVAAPPSRSLWQRLAAFNFAASFGLSLPNAAAVAAVAVAVVLLGLWLATRTDNSAGKDQLAQVTPDGRDQNQPAPPQTTNSTTDNTAVDKSAVVDKSVDDKVATGNDQSKAAQEGASSSPENAAQVASSPPTRRSQLRTPKTSVRESAPAPLDIALLDGGREVALDRRGKLRGLEELPPALQSLVGNTLRTRSVQTSRALASLKSGAGGVLMSAEPGAGDGSFALISPVGKILREQQPLLRWRALAGATSYTVAIVNADFKQVAQSPPLTATEWTPPVPLERGAIYFWQVTAIAPDGREVTSPAPTAPQAKFQVLDGRTFDELRTFAGAYPDSALALGVLYARAGLLDEAANEFEKLVKLNPRSPVARKLLESVR